MSDATARLARIRHSKGYESVSRAMAQDVSISPKALGLLVYLLSLPEHWNTNIARIAKERQVGKDYVATGLQELTRAGYLFRKRRHMGGGVWEWLWLYSDDPPALAEQVAELVGGTFDPDQLAAFAVPDGADGTANPSLGPPVDGDDDDASPQVSPITGFPGDGPPSAEETPGQPITGFPGHGNPSDGNPSDGEPGDKEIHSVESPLPPRVDRAAGLTGSAPASGAPETSPRCEHNLTACRTCGTNPRARRVLAEQITAQLDADRSKRCPMCDTAGQRWDPTTHVAVSPYVRCDHVTPHDAIVTELRAREDADDQARAARADTGKVTVIDRPMKTRRRSRNR